MSHPSLEKITLHTTTPDEIPDAFKNGTYRHIVGVGDLWLPEATRHSTTTQNFLVPKGMKDRVADYFDKYYIQEPDLQRNCHIGAAAISGAGFLKWADATELAKSIVRDEHSNDRTELAPGIHGVIGELIEGESPIVYHSMVGIAPGIGIQTDSLYGPLSLASHPHNLALYKAEVADGSRIYSIDS